MAAVFYNYSSQQTFSPLLLFHVNGTSEHNAIPINEKGRQLAIEIETQWSTVLCQSPKDIIPVA